MARLNKQQLMSLLATLFTNETQVLQILNSCASTVLLLLDEYLKCQTNLEEAIIERNKAIRRYFRRREKFSLRRKRVHWVNPGRTDLWWDNLRNDLMPPSEWKNNVRMDKETFYELVGLLSPMLDPEPNTFRPDSLPADKKVAMSLYYLKDQGGYRMTCNAFGIGKSTLCKVLPQFYNAMRDIAPKFLQLPKTDEETKIRMDAFEAKFGFPQVVGCIDGTHIPIKCPTEHGHDFFLL